MAYYPARPARRYCFVIENGKLFGPACVPLDGRWVGQWRLTSTSEPLGFRCVR